MAKAPILMTRGGFSIRTMQRSDAERVAPELGDCLGANVTVEDCEELTRTLKTPDHGWMQFRVAGKHHAAALVFLEGWERGGRDALNAHYGRPSNRELAKQYRHANPEEGICPDCDGAGCNNCRFACPEN